MQKLYFLRHGVAFNGNEWKGDNDELRPLTEDGIKAMEQESKAIRKLSLNLDAIISSPLERARHTAKITANELDMKIKKNDLLKPGFDRDKLAQLANEYASLNNVMIVGHEPDFSNTIAALIGGGRIEMQKGGLARIDLTNQQPLEGVLVWLLAPVQLGAHVKHKTKVK